MFFFFQNFAERAAVEIFHHKISNATVRRFGDSKIGYVNDIRVAKPSGGASFTAKTLDKLGAFHKFGHDNFDGNGTFRPDVRRKINRSHSASTEFSFDFIFSVKGLPDQIAQIHNSLNANSTSLQVNYATVF